MHHLKVFRILVTIGNKIDALLGRFFWTNQHNKGIHWRKQSVLHQPRGMGGLGICSVRFMNEALLMKQVWRIHKKPHLLLSQCYASSRISLCATSTMPSNLSWGLRDYAMLAMLSADTVFGKLGMGQRSSQLGTAGSMDMYRSSGTLFH